MKTSWTDQENSILRKNSGRDMPTIYQRIREVNPARTFGAIERQLRRLRSCGAANYNPRKTAYDNLRAGYLDIETTDLSANRGFMLSYYIKVAGKDEYYMSRIETKDIHNLTFDKKILGNLLNDLEHFDLLYTYYGSKFDIPFINSRIAKQGLEQIEYQSKFQKDLYFAVRHHHKLTRNTLDEATRIYNLQTRTVYKSKVDIDIWQKAAVGDNKSLAYILTHNKWDVILLEKLHNKLKPLYKQDTFISW